MCVSERVPVRTSCETRARVEMVIPMPCRAALRLAVLAVVLAAASSAEEVAMQVPRQYALQGRQAPNMFPGPTEATAADDAQTPADERSLKLLPKVPLFGKFVLKPKFPKFPFSLKKKLPAFLGGSAAVAGAGGAAGGGALAGLHGLDFTKLGGNEALLHQYPVWKVHRYNGIDLRPVRLGVPAPSGPYPAATPALPVQEPKQVYGLPPKELAVPEPVYGVPAQTYGPPAETYGPPAETYGPPAETYGPPAQTYGPPAETYGPPAQAYGPPSDTPVANSASAASAAGGEDVSESLEALSQLGALTDFLPGGQSGSSGALASLSTLLGTSGRSKGEIFSALTKLKQGFPEILKQAVGSGTGAAATGEAAESTVYRVPQPSGFPGFIKTHPFISSITNGFRGNAESHVALPPLPELPTLPEIKGLKEIPGIPTLPNIKLPTKYVAQGGPYVSVRYPSVAPRGQLPIPSAPTYSAPATSYNAPAAAASAYSAPATSYNAPAAAASAYSAPATSYNAPAAAASTYSVPATSYNAPAASSAYSAPTTAPAPAVEIPAAPALAMLPPARPADTYAAPSAADVGPESAIQQVPVPPTAFTLPLDQPQQQQTYVYHTPTGSSQVTTTRGQVVNSYGVPLSQETYTYSNQQQQQQQYAVPVNAYTAPAAQYTSYSAPVTAYAAPVTAYAAPATTYTAPAAPSSQYGAPDAVPAASETQGRQGGHQGQQGQQSNQDQEDEERVELNGNSRSDHVDEAMDAATGASEAAEVRVAAPTGETRAVSQLVQTPDVTPVFGREQRLRRLEEMRQMVDQMVDLTAYLDPEHPASTADSERVAPAVPAASRQIDAAGATDQELSTPTPA